MSHDVLKYGYTIKMYMPIDVRIDPDPLGNVNCIIRMLRRSDGAILKSVLHTNTPGLQPKIGYGIPIHPKGGFGFTWQLPGWYIEVDGERLMEIHEGAIGPRIPVPVKPWHQRAHRAVRNRFRNLADATANRLGYTRTGDCCCDD